MIAVLGRGIQRLTESAPPRDTSSWVPTEDLEVCDKDSSHLSVRVPADDDNPYSMVGGGELNLLAGMELFRRSGDASTVVVCAYGNRGQYLRSIEAPSESVIMSKRFLDEFPLARLEIWKEDRTSPAPANTTAELENIFSLAVEEGVATVHVVTIDLHMPRVLVLAQRHLADKRFGHLHTRFHVSEQVLIDTNPTLVPRRERLRKSKSFARNWQREQIGIFKILTNRYGDDKPAIERA
jgi:uncharacterized SAM-binding protein YcdF (DUF218 family)